MEVLESPTYQTFSKHLVENNACLIRDLSTRWRALSQWTNLPTSSTPRWDNLLDLYGHLKVPVASQNGNCEEKLLSDVISRWRDQATLNPPEERQYVKDLHLARIVRASKSEDTFYETPDIFKDDWMNAYYSDCTDDDFRFVYIGEEGTVTLLHRDVYASYSWSTNILGRKRWHLYPPHLTPCLHRGASIESGQTVKDVTGPVDTSVFPGWETARAGAIVFEQEEGETVFVPSGWYHQVENLSPLVISINHNWCNSYNIRNVYNAQCKATDAVEAALYDVKILLRDRKGGPDWEREWGEVVQDVVQRDAGWGWSTFFLMLRHALSPPNTASSFPLPSTESKLSPPRTFVLSEVCFCVDDFGTRWEWRVDVGGVREVVSEVRRLVK